MSAQRRSSGHHGHESTSTALEELQGRTDRIAAWVAANPLPILAVIGAILVVAAIWGLIDSGRETTEAASASALAEAERDYRAAMGAAPGQIQVPEPANPEAARTVRSEFVGRFSKVIEEYPGTPAAALAAIEKGSLQRDLGEPEAALSTWQAALDAPAEGSLRALLFGRIAGLHEEMGRFAEAADAHEAASRIEDYPLRHHELAEAARCRAEAGDAEAAVALFQRVEAEAPNLQLAPHVRAQLSELRAALYR